MLDIPNDLLTTNDINTLYMYLDMNFENMCTDDKLFWINLLETLDKDFNETDDTSNTE